MAHGITVSHPSDMVGHPAGFFFKLERFRGTWFLYFSPCIYFSIHLNNKSQEDQESILNYEEVFFLTKCSTMKIVKPLSFVQVIDWAHLGNKADCLHLAVGFKRKRIWCCSYLLNEWWVSRCSSISWWCCCCRWVDFVTFRQSFHGEKRRSLDGGGRRGRTRWSFPPCHLFFLVF